MNRIHFLLLITFIAANSRFRFLGSEGTAIIITGKNLVLLGVLLVCLILLFRLCYFQLNTRYGSQVVYFMSLSLLCFTSLFCHCTRVYVVSNISDLFTAFLGTFIIHYMTGAPGDAPFDLNQPDAAATEEHGDPGGTSRNEASSSSVSTSSEDSSSVDQASGFKEKTALDQRKDDLLMENLQERKGDLGDGQRISTVRQTVETDLHVTNKGEEFEFIIQIEKETGAKKEDCPVTNSTFNEIKEYQSQIQDGGGGGRSTESRGQQEERKNEKTGVLNGNQRPPG